MTIQVINTITNTKTFQSKNKNNNPKLGNLAGSLLSGCVVGGLLYPLGYSAIKKESKGLSKNVIAKKAFVLPVCLGALSAVLNASGIDDVFVKKTKNATLSLKDRVKNIGILSVIGFAAAAGVDVIARESKNLSSSLKKYFLPAIGAALFSVGCAFVTDWLKNENEIGK